MVELAKVMVVIKREYIERVRTKWFIITTVFGPVFMLGISVLPAFLTARNMQQAQITDFRVIDATGSELGKRIAVTLRARAESDPARKLLGDTSKALKPTEIYPTPIAELAAAESLATKAVMAGETRGYLVLDSATLRTGKARYAGKNATSLGEMGQIESALRSGILGERLIASGVPGPKADSLARVRTDLATERITERGRGGGSGLGGFIVGFLIAFLLYMMIILYGQNILRSVLEEKTTRVAEVVISSITPETLLAGKVLGVGAVGLTQQVVWFGFGAAVSVFGVGALAAMGSAGISMPQFGVLQVATLILYFLLGYTFYASLFAAVGAMCNTQEEATQAAQPVMMLLVATIIVVQPILTAPTGTMATVMSILPFSSPIIAPLLMSQTQLPAWQVASSLGALVVSCLVAIWVSARIYRVGLLMTGKRPSLKELVRWVKYA